MGLIHRPYTPRIKAGMQRNCKGMKENQQETKDEYATNDEYCDKNIRLLAPNWKQFPVKLYSRHGVTSQNTAMFTDVATN